MAKILVTQYSAINSVAFNWTATLSTTRFKLRCEALDKARRIYLKGHQGWVEMADVSCALKLAVFSVKRPVFARG
jgi:hypothetical protein